MEEAGSSKRKQIKCGHLQHCQKIGKGHIHALHCLNRMEEFRASETLCDVALESSDGALFKVHKLVLASCSSYFQAMFTNEMRESREEKIKMALDSRVLKVLVEFAYTCKMELKSLADVKAVLVAANMLLFSGAESICVEFITKKINTRNCVDIVSFAEVISSEELSRNAFEFMEKNFVEISSHKGTAQGLGRVGEGWAGLGFLSILKRYKYGTKGDPRVQESYCRRWVCKNAPLNMTTSNKYLFIGRV